ncbi:MAG: Asp/Glu racemase [Hyphomicrobiales bacterium]|nr:MAG: Asp/Glu racemase [Hyphomicrobiales bacterium]
MALPFTTDDGFGARARLGLIVLQADETIEPEFARIMALENVVLHMTRIPMAAEITPETLMSMKANLPAAAALLPEIPFDAIGYGCTSASTVIGVDGVEAAVRSVHPDAAVSNPISAVLAACEALEAKRIGFVTPYRPDVSAAMRELLEKNGLTIAGFGSFEESDDRVVGRISPASVLDAIKSVAAMGDCDAVFVSCTNLRVAGIVSEAEAAIGKPVFSSNLALAWHMLRLAGIQDDIPGLGRLYRMPLADKAGE